MKLSLWLSTTVLLAFSASAFANSYIVCGKTADWETASVTDFELALSSDNDDYSGPVGGRWNLKLVSDESEWVAPTKSIVAKTIEKDGQKIVEVKITTAKASSGPVGTKYLLKNLFDEEPVLEKYTMGGFAGTLLVDTFKCAASFD